MKFNNTCSFSCPEGYQLQGPSYKQCGANGQWTGSARSVSCQNELKITDVTYTEKTTEKTTESSFYLFENIFLSLRITANNADNIIFRYQRVHGVKWGL